MRIARSVPVNAVLLFACVMATRAGAHEPPRQALVCESPEVLARVAGVLGARGRAGVLAPLAGQVPTALPEVVSCAVMLREVSYDTDRCGLRPITHEQSIEYTVRRGRNGLFVSVAEG